MSLAVVFSHGQESGPWGTKIRALADVARYRQLAVTSVDYRGMADPGDRVDKLISVCRGIDAPLLLVGSSMGGHVATAAAATIKPAAVFAMAPAYHVPGFEALTPDPPPCPLTIVHGWRDDVVPLAGVLSFAEAARAETHIIDSDHRLSDSVATLKTLFERCLDNTLRRLA
ncbi:MAG: alpha/beta fold hydrolase [Pseudomonadota bacterium]